ncbi:DUF1801 domain-containing protein [Ferruginibacter sp.]
MSTPVSAAVFLSQYNEAVVTTALQLQTLVLKELPGVTEQVDVPAKMVAYCYGQKYVEMICTIIPSKNGLKLGFYKGNELPDPEHLLEGNGKISRYVVITPGKPLPTAALKQLLKAALAAYKTRMKK